MIRDAQKSAGRLSSMLHSKSAWPAFLVAAMLAATPQAAGSTELGARTGDDEATGTDVASVAESFRVAPDRDGIEIGSPNDDSSAFGSIESASVAALDASGRGARGFSLEQCGVSTDDLALAAGESEYAGWTNVPALVDPDVVTINGTLDTTPPVPAPAYATATGTQTGRLTRNGVPSVCGAPKPNPGLASATGSRQYDLYRFVALSSGCATVTLSNAGNNLLFSLAYDQNGINITDPSLNYLADAGASPVTANPTRTFGFDVTIGQIFSIVVHEVNPAGGIGQSYTLEVAGVKLDPDVSINTILDTTAPPLSPAYSGGTGNLTGRLNRFNPASSCAAPKANPGLFTATGARRADGYYFIPEGAGCALVTTAHTGVDQAQTVAYDRNGFVASNPSTNYLADPGPSASNSTTVFSFEVLPRLLINDLFSIVVSEVNPGAGIGDSYFLNISNVALVPTLQIYTKLDALPPPTRPEYASSTGTQTGRINRFPPVATCDAPKVFPGLFTPTGTRLMDTYTFAPNWSGCVEVTLWTPDTPFNVYMAAYDQNGFIPSNPGTNYLADHGNSPNVTNPRTFSFNVTAGVPFSLVVHEVSPGGGDGQVYVLEVAGIAFSTPGFPFFFDGFETGNTGAWSSASP